MTSTTEKSNTARRLREIYREHAPRKVKNIPGLLSKWRGRETTLLRKVQKKYGLMVCAVCFKYKSIDYHFSRIERRKGVFAKCATCIKQHRPLSEAVQLAASRSHARHKRTGKRGSSRVSDTDEAKMREISDAAVENARVRQQQEKAEAARLAAAEREAKRLADVAEAKAAKALATQRDVEQREFVMWLKSPDKSRDFTESRSDGTWCQETTRLTLNADHTCTWHYDWDMGRDSSGVTYKSGTWFADYERDLIVTNMGYAGGAAAWEREKRHAPVGPFEKKEYSFSDLVWGRAHDFGFMD